MIEREAMPKGDSWTGWRANLRVLLGYIAAIGFFGIGYNCLIFYQHGFRSSQAIEGLWGSAVLTIPVLMMRGRIPIIALGFAGLALPGLFNSILNHSLLGASVCLAILALGIGILRLAVARDRGLEEKIARWGTDQLTLRAGWWRPELPANTRGWFAMVLATTCFLGVLIFIVGHLTGKF